MGNRPSDRGNALWSDFHVETMDRRIVYTAEWWQSYGGQTAF